MSTYEQFLATKNLGSAVGTTDPAVIIAGKDNSGNAAPFKINSSGELVVTTAAGGGDATKNLGSAIGATDPSTVIAAKDNSGNAAPLKVGSTGGLILDPASIGAGGSSDATAANQVTGNTRIGDLTETAPASDTASSGLNGRLQRIAQRITSLIALVPAALTGSGNFKVAVNEAVAAGENVIGKTAGYGFDVVVAPTVTNGAYTASFIMGGLMTFTVARVNDEPVLINEIQIAFKSAVTPALLLVFFEADPTGTTKTDHSAYNLAVSDVFKVRCALPVNDIGGYLTDHGTPNTIRLPHADFVIKPASGTRDIYMLMVDTTGVTLTSTSDVQVRICGVGA